MRRSVSAVVVLLTLACAAAQAEGPLPVSPGGQAEMAAVASRCPTFHWTAVEGAESVNLVVYRVPEEGPDGPPELVLSITLPGAANGWTPSLSQCLEPGGRYAWSVGAGGEWSEATVFDVAAAPSLAEVKEAMTVLRRYFGQEGVRGSATPSVEVTVAAEDRGERRESGGSGSSGIRIDGNPVLSGYERVVGPPEVCPSPAECPAEVFCPDGKVALGGGANSAITFTAFLVASYPPTDDQWSVTVRNNSGVDAVFEPWVTCAHAL